MPHEMCSEKEINIIFVGRLSKLSLGLCVSKQERSQRVYRWIRSICKYVDEIEF